MKPVDSHTHLLDVAFDADREVLLKTLADEVAAIVECAGNVRSFERVLALAEKYPYIYGAVGVHPESASCWSPAAAERLREHLCKRKIVAVGEVGLDYHYEPGTAILQRRVLADQLDIAVEMDKPVILHNRESTRDMLDLLAAHKGNRGVVHCFTEGPAVAKQVLDRGFYMGFGGILTFRNPGPAAEAVRYAPMDRILLETDSPYLAPVPMRGHRNNPAYVRFVAGQVAVLRGMREEEVIAAANANAAALFGLTI